MLNQLLKDVLDYMENSESLVNSLNKTAEELERRVPSKELLQKAAELCGAEDSNNVDNVLAAVISRLTVEKEAAEQDSLSPISVGQAADFPTTGVSTKNMTKADEALFRRLNLI